jgi:hypothetical protein
MVVKVLAHDASNVSVLDRGPGIADHEVQHLCRWVSRNHRDATVRARVGEFRLARRAPAEGGSCFTFVVDED